jgi:hypothetical protein
VVEVSDEDLRFLAGWDEFPYKGRSPKAFVKYLAALLEKIEGMEGEDRGLLPDLVKELHDDLGADSGNRVVEDVWVETENPIPTKLLALDDNGDPIAGASVNNGSQYF